MRDFSMSRRSFIVNSAVGVALASALPSSVKGQDKPKIQGFDETDTAIDPNAKWEPFTDRKLRIGIAGYGLCQFGAQFGLQDHPNAEVVAVTDLFPDR